MARRAGQKALVEKAARDNAVEAKRLKPTMEELAKEAREKVKHLRVPPPRENAPDQPLDSRPLTDGNKDELNPLEKSMEKLIDKFKKKLPGRNK